MKLIADEGVDKPVDELVKPFTVIQANAIRIRK